MGVKLARHLDDAVCEDALLGRLGKKGLQGSLTTHAVYAHH